MSSVFEVFNDEGKLSITDETPCVYVIAKRKIGAYDSIQEISGTDHNLTFSNLGGKVYFIGFDLNQLPNGTICIDTRGATGLHNFAYVQVYGNLDSVRNVDLYFFGIRQKTDDSLAGMELYDKDGYVLFTSRPGTQYPKVLRASSDDSVSFLVTTDPEVFVVVGWDVLADGVGRSNPLSGGSSRRLPWVTKNGTSITVNKDYAGNYWPSLKRSEYLYNWLLLMLQTVE